MREPFAAIFAALLTGFALSSLFACSLGRIALPLARGQFLGVRFGDSLEMTRRVRPEGHTEVSPTGQDAYRLSDFDSDGIIYKTVIFQFGDKRGMQLVIARFADISTDAVLAFMRRRFGKPERSGRSYTDAPDNLEEHWRLPGGGSADVLGVSHLLIMRRSQSPEIDHDLKLRLEGFGLEG